MAVAERRVPHTLFAHQFLVRLEIVASLPIKGRAGNRAKSVPTRSSLIFCATVACNPSTRIMGRAGHGSKSAPRILRSLVSGTTGALRPPQARAPAKILASAQPISRCYARQFQAPSLVLASTSIIYRDTVWRKNTSVPIRTYAVGVLPSAERYFIFLCFRFCARRAQKRKHLNREVPCCRRL